MLSVSALTAKEENFAYGNRLEEQEALQMKMKIRYLDVSSEERQEEVPYLSPRAKAQPRCTPYLWDEPAQWSRIYLRSQCLIHLCS